MNIKSGQKLTIPLEENRELKKEQFQKLSTNMKNTILILIIVMINSCSGTEKCTLGFGHCLNDKFFELWNAKTKKSMLEDGDEKSRSILSFEKKYNTSIFDRYNFQKTFKEAYEDNKNFNELWILEINYSGEKNQHVKYLIGICNEESYISKFALGINGWINSQTYIVKIQKIKFLYQLIKNNRSKYNYWGGNINDVACLTQIKSDNNVNVQYLNSLNKAEFAAISGLNLKDY